MQAAMLGMTRPRVQERAKDALATLEGRTSMQAVTV
jgi:hypothetical protein